MKLCPNCGASLAEVIGGYMCHECGGGMFSEDEVICPQCPRCGDELGELGDEFYCFSCPQSVSRDSAVYSKGSSGDDFEFDDSDYDFEEPDYDSMINNGDEICLNCAYWGVSQLGAAYGMECRRGQFSEGPGDSCSLFSSESHFSSYGSDGQYQFDETDMSISNKLFYWKNSR